MWVLGKGTMSCLAVRNSGSPPPWYITPIVMGGKYSGEYPGSPQSSANPLGILALFTMTGANTHLPFETAAGYTTYPTLAPNWMSYAFRTPPCM